MKLLIMLARITTYLFLALSLAFATPAQALTIIEQDLVAAQTQAKSENKLIVVDFFTSWCGPCKHFSRTLENNEAFAAAIAENFIMLKYDAENDTHGLTRKYHINAYPTFILLTADMRLISKDAGYSDEDSYLKFLNAGIVAHNEGEFISGVSRNINMDFPQFYVDHMSDVGSPIQEEINAYWDQAQDKTDEVSFAIISTTTAPDEIYEFYIENLETYRSRYGDYDANSVAQGICVRKLYGAVEADDEEAWAMAQAFTIEILEEEGAELLTYIAPSWYSGRGDWPGFGKYVDEGIANGVIKMGVLNGLGWTVFQNCDDQTVIEKAIGWMTPLIEEAPDFNNLDTYAWLFFKNDQKEQARKYILMAIEAGRAEGSDVSGSEEMLPLLED